MLPLATFVLFRRFIGVFDASASVFDSLEMHVFATFCGCAIVLGVVAIYLIMMSLVDLFFSLFDGIKSWITKVDRQKN